jgi:hypothetical protein
VIFLLTHSALLKTKNYTLIQKGISLEEQNYSSN